MDSKIFFLSGLGADKRAFASLDLSTEKDIVYVDWMIPYKKESIQNYANRLIQEYQISKQDILVGLSFGGLMAVEILHLLNNDKVVLISSASCKKELHPFVRITGVLGLNYLLPKSKLNQPNKFIYKGFNVKSETEKELLTQIIKDSNNDFVYWALHKMGQWNRKERHPSIIKIHGDNDLMIPINNKPNDLTINDGGHFMVVDRAPEVSEILNTLI